MKKLKGNDADHYIYDDEINEAFMKTREKTMSSSTDSSSHDNTSYSPFSTSGTNNVSKLKEDESEKLQKQHNPQQHQEHNVKVLVEKDLKSYIVDHMSAIEEGLQIHSQDLETEVGQIDILAVDKNSNFVVFSLNTGVTNETSISSISACMSWVKDNTDINPNSKGVRGFLIAKEFDSRTIAASRVIPSLELRMYKPYLEFHAV